MAPLDLRTAVCAMNNTQLCEAQGSPLRVRPLSAPLAACWSEGLRASAIRWAQIAPPVSFGFCPKHGGSEGRDQRVEVAWGSEPGTPVATGGISCMSQGSAVIATSICLQSLEGGPSHPLALADGLKGRPLPCYANREVPPERSRGPPLPAHSPGLERRPCTKPLGGPEGAGDGSLLQGEVR